MKKSILNLGTALNRKEQREVFGGQIHPSLDPCSRPHIQLTKEGCNSSGGGSDIPPSNDPVCLNGFEWNGHTCVQCLECGLYNIGQ